MSHLFVFSFLLFISDDHVRLCCTYCTGVIRTQGVKCQVVSLVDFKRRPHFCLYWRWTWKTLTRILISTSWSNSYLNTKGIFVLFFNDWPKEFLLSLSTLVHNRGEFRYRIPLEGNFPWSDLGQGSQLDCPSHPQIVPHIPILVSPIYYLPSWPPKFQGKPPFEYYQRRSWHEGEISERSFVTSFVVMRLEEAMLWK